MSLTIISTPERVKHLWHEEGTRNSIAGTQRVLAHEATGARVLLSDSGLEYFQSDEDFQNLLGNFAVISAMPRAEIRDFSFGLPAPSIRSARSSANGYRPRLSTIYAPVKNDNLIIKTFDFNPSLALRQFDTMGFVAKKLAQHNFNPKISSPAQHAFISPKGSGNKAIFMEKIDYDRYPDGSRQQIPPDFRTRLGIIGKLYIATMPLGPFLFNDFFQQNFLQKTHNDGSIEYFIIDQPQQRPLPTDPAKIALPLANLACKVIA